MIDTESISRAKLKRVPRPAVIDPMPAHSNAMVQIPGGVFMMGSNNHYPEEAPAHRVEVNDFLMDATPVTNDQFAEFVKATGHVTTAEVAPNPRDHPGALPEMLLPACWYSLSQRLTSRVTTGASGGH